MPDVARTHPLGLPRAGMEAIYRIEVADFSAFIRVDDKGNDFFRQLC